MTGVVDWLIPSYCKNVGVITLVQAWLVADISHTLFLCFLSHASHESCQLGQSWPRQSEAGVRDVYIFSSILYNTFL